MLVLDTDHMSLLEWGSKSSGALRERLADIAPGQLADFGKVPGLKVEDWTT